MSKQASVTILQGFVALVATALLGCEPFGVNLGNHPQCVADSRLAAPALRSAGERVSSCAVLGDGVLVNAGFEAPLVESCQGGAFCHFAAVDVPAWKTSSSDQSIEIWNDGHRDVPAPEGAQFVELNSVTRDTLWQDVQLEPGSLMYWSLQHRGRNGVESLELLIGPPDATASQAEIVDGQDDWYQHSGLYRVGPGEAITRFALASRFGTAEGNLVDAIYFAPVFDR